VTFLNPSLIIWLLLPLAALAAAVSGQRRRRQAHRDLAGPEARGRGILRRGMLPVLTGILLLVPALMRPVSNPREREVKTEGRNIVFLVDVSRSMLAEDLVPNRLERARYDILSVVPALSGNRVGLVAFAGNSVLKCPLTLDYSYFSQAVSDLSTGSVSRGGTNLGDAVRRVIDDLFLESDRAMMDIILITDGEDQDSFPVEAARKAGEAGIRIVTMALGDADQSSPVPSGEENREEYVTYEDQVVYSRPDLKTLQAMSDASGTGWMVHVPEGTLELKGILSRIRREGKSENTGTMKQYIYDEHYRWLLLPSFFLILTGLVRRRSLDLTALKRFRQRRRA